MAVTKEQQAATLQWLREFNAAGDALKPSPWIRKYFTPDAEMVQPGQPNAKGHDAIIAAMEAQLGVIASIKHTIHHVDVLPERVYQEATVEWTVEGDPEAKVVTARGLGVFLKRVEEDRISRFDVYADFSALVKRIEEVHGKVRP